MGQGVEDRKFVKKRRVPRRAFVRNVGLLVSGKYVLGAGLEVGEGGMMISTDQTLAEGSYALITFKLPNYEPTVVKAVVRYSLGKDEERAGWHKFGLEFINLDFYAKREIRNYVASKSALEDKAA